MSTANETRNRPANASNPTQQTPRSNDPCRVLQGYLLFDMLIRAFIWSSSIALTCTVFSAFGWWPDTGPAGGLGAAVLWSAGIAWWVIVYNLVYVAELVLLRWPIPTPEPGVYSTAGKLDLKKRGGRQLFYACLISFLTKARYEAPFPAFLVFQTANLPPMRWLMGPIFGPKSRSCYVTEPTILDPSFVEIGRNVVIGSGTDIAGHCQLPDLVSLKKTTIDDDAVIGANCTIFGGVHIRRGAMIGAGSVVAPYTVVGEREYWHGVPAVKIRDLPRPGHLLETA